MLEASWRLARRMLSEVGAKMSPRWTKIAQDGSKIKKIAPSSDLGTVLVPSWVAYFFSSRARSRPEAPGMERVAVAGGGGVAGGG